MDKSHLGQDSVLVRTTEGTTVGCSETAPLSNTSNVFGHNACGPKVQ